MFLNRTSSAPGFVVPPLHCSSVIPAQAGIQIVTLDSRLRANDNDLMASAPLNQPLTLSERERHSYPSQTESRNGRPKPAGQRVEYEFWGFPSEELAHRTSLMAKKHRPTC
jgi:hypothetical protein